MFHLNQFIKHEYLSPITISKNINTAELYYDDKQPLPSNDHHEYLLDGKTYSSTFRPNSKETKERLSYIEGFIFSENQTAYFVKRCNNQTYLLLFTYDGEGYLEYENQKILLKKGDGCLIDCQKPHYYKTSKGSWTHFDLHINGYFVESVFQHLHASKHYTFSQPVDGAFQEQLEKLVELYNDVSPIRELLISSLLDQLLSGILSNSEKTQAGVRNLPENLRYLIQYINSNYMHDLSLDCLSEFSHISKSHLIRLFNMYLHYTPTEYIIQLRLNNALTLLKETALPAAKICIMVGIDNENYFRHLFKRRFGITPNQYRKENSGMSPEEYRNNSR